MNYCSQIGAGKSNCNTYPCKRKIDEPPYPKAKKVLKFKKARHPWQIKGISIERNIISQEVKLNDDDPNHMVGVIKYEEKGILSVDLSTPSCNMEIDSKANFSKTSEEELDNELNEDVTYPTASNQVFVPNNCKTGPSDLDIFSSTANSSKELSHEHFEGECQSSMDHDTLGRERNAIDDVNPTLHFQQSVWQKREMGCAIVDNVFNKTLEEMGLSPDPKVNRFATDRLQILQQGIDAAINHRGLVPHISEPGHMEHSPTHVDKNKTVNQDFFGRRRLSLEDMPCSKMNSQRRLSQPLGSFAMKFQDSTNVDDSNVDKSVDESKATDIDGATVANTNNVCIETDHKAMSDQNPVQVNEPEDDDMGSPKLETRENSSASVSENETYEREVDRKTSSKILTNSENLIDLAVSTAIQSQGLGL